MVSFLLQTVNNIIVHDFVLAVYNNIQYRQWHGEEVHYILVDINDLKPVHGFSNYIPIGSIEFVEKFNEVYFNDELNLKPLNVPETLLEYKAETYNIKIPGTDLFKFSKGSWYVKSQDKVKDPLNGWYTNLTKLPDGEYQVSKHTTVLSEWRGFIKNGKLEDCRCYSGDYMLHPDYKTVEKYISKLNYDFPYTLDVFVDDRLDTRPMEVHKFYSVGLYGFNDPNISQMFSQAWYHVLNYIKSYKNYYIFNIVLC